MCVCLYGSKWLFCAGAVKCEKKRMIFETKAKKLRKQSNWSLEWVRVCKTPQKHPSVSSLLFFSGLGT